MNGKLFSRLAIGSIFLLTVILFPLGQANALNQDLDEDLSGLKGNSHWKRTPTPTPTKTSTPLPTNTPTPLPTDTPTPTPNPRQPLPYGPFHNSNYGRTFFDGAHISGAEWSLLSTIRTAGYRVLAAAANPDPCSHLINQVFDVNGFINEILAHKSDILDYASDGTLVGLMELNEPHNPTRCSPIEVSALAAAGEAFWAAFPELSPATFYFGYGSPPTYFETGGGAPAANVAFAQFAAGKGTIEEYMLPQQESAVRQNMKLIYSANLYSLGITETVAANIWECAQTDGIFVTLWTDRYVFDTDQDAYATALSACNAP